MSERAWHCGQSCPRQRQSRGRQQQDAGDAGQAERCGGLPRALPRPHCQWHRRAGRSAAAAPVKQARVAPHGAARPQLSLAGLPGLEKPEIGHA